MVRVPNVPRPSNLAISQSVLGGLRVAGNLTPGMVATVTFEPTLGIAARRINKLGMDIRSFREPLTRAVRQVMMPSIAENFNVGGRPSWEPLSEATWDIRKRFGWEGGSTLVLTGKLRAGASSFKIWTITRDNAIIRDLPQSIWYGKVHQAGYEGQSMSKLTKKHGSAGGAFRDIIDRQKHAMATGSVMQGSGSRTSPSIPARPFLVIQPQDEDDIQDVFLEWLEERVNAAWPPVG